MSDDVGFGEASGAVEGVILEGWGARFLGWILGFIHRAGNPDFGPVGADLGRDKGAANWHKNYQHQ